MDVQRVEWIANLVRHAGGEQRERAQLLGLNGLLGRAPALSDVAQNYGVADLIGCTCSRGW